MSDKRFTGGDNLTPGTMEYYFHRSLMNSELSGGMGAYQISDAKRAASGPSFGPLQYDLGSGNARARELFEDIATSARGADGNLLISANELRDIKSHLYKPSGQFNAADREVYERLKPKMDQALGSDQGRAAIDADYPPALTDKMNDLNAKVDAIPNERNKAFVSGNPVAKLMIMDTANQYGPAVNNGLKEFMGKTKDDPAMTMPGRTPRSTIKVEGEFGLEDMIRYKLETAYAQNDGGAKDTLRRVSNLIDAVGVDKVKESLSEEDRKFLDTGLKDYLKEHGRDPKILNSPDLRALNEVVGHTVGRASPAHAGTQVLHEGSSGHDVTKLQNNLAGIGLVAGTQAGQYDATTKAAVEDFQRSHGLTADGKAGPKTQEALKNDISETQKELSGLGYKGNGRPLTADGAYGPATADALKSFQRDRGLPESGVADQATRSAIHAAVQAHAPARQPQPSPRLDSPDHPGNGLYKEALSHVHDIDARLGRTPDERSANLAGGLAVQARADGLQRIDTVALSDDGSRLWAVEQPRGRTDHLFDKQTSVPTSMANVPLEQSSRQWPQAEEQAQARTAAQTQTQSQQQQPPQVPMSP